MANKERIEKLLDAVTKYKNHDQSDVHTCAIGIAVKRLLKRTIKSFNLLSFSFHSDITSAVANYLNVSLDKVSELYFNRTASKEETLRIIRGWAE